MKLGRNLARTFLDYYKLQNHIVFKPSLVGKNDYTPNNTTNSLQTRQKKLVQSFNNKSGAILSNSYVSIVDSTNENKFTNNETMFSLDDGYGKLHFQYFNLFQLIYLILILILFKKFLSLRSSENSENALYSSRINNFQKNENN